MNNPEGDDSVRQYTKDCLLGKKVICKSNENDSFIIGTIVGFEESGPIKGYLHVQIASKNILIPMGVVFPYSEALENCLAGVSHADNWRFLSDITTFLANVKSLRR